MANIRGVLLTNLLNQTGMDFQTQAAVTWNSIVYDTSGFYSIASPTKITIPSSVNGQYGIFTACIAGTNFASGAASQLDIWKIGATNTYNGYATRFEQTVGGNGQSSEGMWMQVNTGPILLTTGDQYSAALYSGDGNTVTINAESSFGLYVLDNASTTQRCLATITTDQTTKNFSTPTAIAFDGTDVYDTDSIHDPASNNTKLIIPAALNNKMGVVFSQINITSYSPGNVNSLAIQKNGSLTYKGIGGNSGRTATQTFAGKRAQTQVIRFLTGDQFEALFCTNDTSVTVSGSQANGQTQLGLWVYGDLVIAPRSFGTILT